MKNGEGKYTEKEKVMNYFPSEKFDISKFTDQKSFQKDRCAFYGKTT